MLIICFESIVEGGCKVKRYWKCGFLNGWSNPLNLKLREPKIKSTVSEYIFAFSPQQQAMEGYKNSSKCNKLTLKAYLSKKKKKKKKSQWVWIRMRKAVSHSETAFAEKQQSEQGAISNQPHSSRLYNHESVKIVLLHLMQLLDPTSSPTSKELCRLTA